MERLVRAQGAVEAQEHGPWPATQLSFCPGDGNRLAALGAGALALWRMHTLAGPPELYLSAVADPGATCWTCPCCVVHAACAPDLRTAGCTLRS